MFQVRGDKINIFRTFHNFCVFFVHPLPPLPNHLPGDWDFPLHHGRNELLSHDWSVDFSGEGNLHLAHNPAAHAVRNFFELLRQRF